MEDGDYFDLMIQTGGLYREEDDDDFDRYFLELEKEEPEDTKE